MSKLDWNQIRDEFRWDGTWRDIYVSDTSIEHWQKALDVLSRTYSQVDFSQAGTPTQLPCAIVDLFSEQESTVSTLTIYIGGLTLSCHFFTANEIEFSLDPREVVNQADFDSIVQFMHRISDATLKEVILTPENLKEISIFRVSPGHRDV